MRSSHGMWKHELYNTWNNMMERCYTQKSVSYKNYGAKGIKVCRRWHDIRAFIDDMHPKPSPQHQLDRVDNLGDYSPRNCRWVTRSEQAYNRGNPAGVSWNRRKKMWEAYIGGRASGGVKWLGAYRSREKAILARKEAENERKKIHQT